MRYKFDDFPNLASMRIARHVSALSKILLYLYRLLNCSMELFLAYNNNNSLELCPGLFRTMEAKRAEAWLENTPWVMLSYSQSLTDEGLLNALAERDTSYDHPIDVFNSGGSMIVIPMEPCHSSQQFNPRRLVPALSL